MPVLVIGADRALGAAAARALLRTGGQVRVVVEPSRSETGTVAGLRAAGCKVARSALDDEARLELALEQVHTVVHAAVGPMAPAGAVLDGVASVMSAAIGAGCRRLVLIAPFGGVPAAGNPYLDAVAHAVDLLAEAPLEAVVLHCALPYGPAGVGETAVVDDPLVLALAGGAATGYPGVGEARHAPVFVDDVGAAVAAADRERGTAGDLSVVVRLAGPRTLPLAEFARLLGAPAGRMRGSLAWLRGTVPVLPDHVVDLLRRGEPDVAATTTPTPPDVGADRLRAASGR